MDAHVTGVGFLPRRSRVRRQLNDLGGEGSVRLMRRGVTSAMACCGPSEEETSDDDPECDERP